MADQSTPADREIEVVARVMVAELDPPQDFIAFLTVAEFAIEALDAVRAEPSREEVEAGLPGDLLKALKEAPLGTLPGDEEVLRLISDWRRRRGEDPFTMDAVLCDHDGIVRRGVMHHGTDYTCTGHAHLAGEHIRCSSPAHTVRAEPSSEPPQGAINEAIATLDQVDRPDLGTAVKELWKRRRSAEPSPEGEPSEVAYQGELRRLDRAIQHVTAHDCQWLLISYEDPECHELCSLCGAQRNKDGPLEERASVTGGWPLEPNVPAPSTERAEAADLAAHVQALHDEEHRLAFLDDAAGAVMRSWAQTHQHHAEEPYIGCVFCRDRFMPVSEHEAALAEARAESGEERRYVKPEDVDAYWRTLHSAEAALAEARAEVERLRKVLQRASQRTEIARESLGRLRTALVSPPEEGE